MCRTTKAVFEKTDVTPAQVTGISFCSQMQGMVLVDEYGRALRRPMSYMDQRASAEFKACQTHGPCVSGVNIGMLLRSLRATHAASTSVKDPLWKYKWVQAHEPEIFQEAHKWLDVKESLIARATGEFVMTRDSAYSTFLYDTRPGHEGWNEELCRMYGVETRHLAKIIECTDVAGLLTEQAARELGLCPGTRVYGGGGDATLIGVGAGQQSRIHCTRLAGNKADIWQLRHHPKVLGLPFRPDVSRPNRDNAIDVYISDEWEDVLGDGVWAETFTTRPEPLTPAEKKEWLSKVTGVCLGSDAFFPFGDNIERARRSGVTAIVEPGGSIRDGQVIETCDKYGIVMAFNGIRLFHH